MRTFLSRPQLTVAEDNYGLAIAPQHTARLRNEIGQPDFSTRSTEAMRKTISGGFTLRTFRGNLSSGGHDELSRYRTCVAGRFARV